MARIVFIPQPDLSVVTGDTLDIVHHLETKLFRRTKKHHRDPYS